MAACGDAEGARLTEGRESLRSKVAEIPLRTMLEATGVSENLLLPAQRTSKNADVVKRGRQGGRNGGEARATRMAPEKRRTVAENRWKDKQAH